MIYKGKSNIYSFLFLIIILGGVSFAFSLTKNQFKFPFNYHNLQSSSTDFKNKPYNYTVPGKIPILKQENKMACWATVVTMLVSWKENKEYTVERVLEKSGKEYLDLFFDEKGLESCGKKNCPSPSKEDLLKKLGMQAEGPQSFTEMGWLNLLKEHGPLWITSQLKRENDELAKFSTHARILFGMNRDDKGVVLMKIIDPETGTSYDEKFEDFFRRYENAAREDLDILNRQTDKNGDKDFSVSFQPQVIHF